MSSRQTLVGWGAVLAASVLLCFSLSAGQEPRRGRPAQAAEEAAPDRDPATLLPADPVLYVGWDGEAAHREAWERTAAYQALYETGLVGVAQKMLAGLFPQAASGQAELVSALSETVRRNGVSAAVTLPEADGPTLPWGVVVLHGGAGLEPRIAEAIRALLPPGSGAEFHTEDRSGRTVTTVTFEQLPIAQAGWWTDGGHLVVAAGAGAVNHALAVAEGNAEDVTTSRFWKAYRTGEQPFEVASVAWLDMAKLLEAVGPIALPIAGPDRPPITIAQLAETAGLDGLRAVIFRTGFQGPATVGDVRTETTGDRDGLVGLCFQEPITLDSLPPLPQRLSGFHAASFDFAEFYEVMLGVAREAVKLGPPEASQELEQGLGKAREAIGLDVKPDLLDPLGHVMCVYNDAAQGPLGLGFTIAISVDDADRLRTSLDRLLERLGRQFPPHQLNVRRTSKHGRQIVTLEVAEAVFNPSFVVTDEWLVVSVVPQALDTFLLRADGKLPTWKPEGELAEALQGVPKEFTRLSVSDPRETYRLIAGLAPVVLPIVRKVAAQGNPVELETAVAELPPAELVAGPLFPNVSVTYVEGDVIVKHSRSSLPGLPFGDNSVGPATAAVAVALVLPAVQQARLAARRTQSQNNLKQIAIALHNHHDTFKEFPAGTIAKSAEKPEDRLSWYVSVLPYLEQAPLYQRFDQNRAWNAGGNAEAARTTVPTLINPQIGPPAEPGEAAPTHYVGLAGVGEDGPTLPVNHPKAGVFAYDRTTRFADILDGTSNTIMTSEATAGSAGPWAKGGAGTIRPLTKKPYINGPDGIGGPFPGGCHVGMGDGSVRFVSENIAPEVMEALVTIRGGEPIGDF